MSDAYERDPHGLTAAGPHMKAGSEFERQVEDALAHGLLIPLDGETLVGYYQRAMALLAPRVAAAIDTALYGSELEDFYRQKALAALRGEAS